MDEHKWDFALEEAVKELETEYSKKQSKLGKEQRSKKRGFLKRFISKKKKEKQAPEEEKDSQVLDQQNNNEPVEAKPEKKLNSPIIELKDSCNSPIMNGSNLPRPTLRRQGVAERNETERQVVYRTLKNYNQINKLHDYDLV